MFKLESSLERLRKNTVAHYRRLKTPWFYVNLKTETYTRYNRRVYGISLPFGGWMSLPENLRHMSKGWEIQGSDKSIDRAILEKLDAINERPHDNVLKISA